MSMHVRDADTSGKADDSPISELAFSSSELASLSSELRRVQRLHVTSADKSGIEDGPWFLCPIWPNAYLLEPVKLNRWRLK
ncbi:hypothetical protein ACFX2G_030706 [Malus domestica]